MAERKMIPNPEHPLWYTVRFLGLVAAAAVVLSQTATHWDWNGEGVASLGVGGAGVSFLIGERLIRAGTIKKILKAALTLMGEEKK